MTIYTKKRPKLKTTTDFYLYKSCELYSYLPEDIQQLNGRKYREALKGYILLNFPYNKLYHGTDEYPP